MARAKPARKAAAESAAEVAARATGADRAVGRSMPRRPAPTPGLLPTAELVDTRSKILDAAYRCLATEGYAALSIREIGKAAGVNSALINYHFGTKDQLVIEGLDAANARLLARQKAMYRGSRGFAEKWAEARRFYESDLASGFVRVQAELMAAGYSNPWLRERVAGRVEAWGDLIHDTVREALHELTAQGVELPAPLTAEVIANWMCHFWIGMEVGDLLGGWSRRRPNVAALDAVQELLDSLDTLAARRVRLTAGKGRVR
jgi:AcrR family transcriptional regulator